ncbi:hypothetical protein SCOCK_250033 [Actinacidiphila cocklensis]|uniref:Uncharacterized protein n=1 Tax=Actinacidiphila cocklensis TaxID=887465 RepID=A0A9W4DQK3_9ACTN|nr:hypothetical protein SCOCK_250033 [Actinacidiphila cocklensis]
MTQTRGATRRPPEPRSTLEARDPPRVRRDPGHLHLWRLVHHPQHRDERHDPRRGLLRVPPVLHGQAEDPRHRRPRGPLRGPLRQGRRVREEVATRKRRFPVAHPRATGHRRFVVPPTSFQTPSS